VNTRFDIAVVGAGPVGCVTALAFARRGASVLLLESRPNPGRRLAGEWIHPPGVEVFRELGLGALLEAAAHPPGRGFVVFPGDGSAPIVLNYPGGETAFTCEHHALVSALREAAAAHPHIRFRTHDRLSSIANQKLTFSDDSTVHASLIVGADGRSSFTRRCLGLDDERTLLSHMAGVLVEDAELPFEGYGHVFLGGPGPVFVLRISPQHVRVCLDVPSGSRDTASKTGSVSYLEGAYGPLFPERFRKAFGRALRSQPIAWAANQWRPRRHYGRDGVPLVGDAVGHFHPLTAVGMTLGFLDGVYLAQSRNLADYRCRRTEQTRVPELLAVGLHKVFTQQDEGTLALRQAVFRMWRQNPADRAGTMKVLSGQVTRLTLFNRAFLKVLTLAVQNVLQHSVWTGHWRRTARTFTDFGGWVGWLAAGTGAGVAGTNRVRQAV
jgi:2-polyprenyl-6-methoxyphenol hydroxylase-like FAD-dependent oxidoreductase